MNKPNAQIYHFDLYGKRDEKYEFLNQHSLKTIVWNELNPQKPSFFFTNKNFEGSGKYKEGFKVDELFKQNSSGVETRKDSLAISMDDSILKKIIFDFRNLSIIALSSKYQLNDDSRDWKINWAKEDIINNNPQIISTQYKPLDSRHIIYTGKTKGINGYPMYANFKHFILGANVGLCLMKQLVNTTSFSSVFITKTLMDKNFYGFQTYAFPLYLYPEHNAQQTLGTSTSSAPGGRTPNLNMEIVNKIADKLGLEFVPEKDLTGFQNLSGLPPTFAPIDILDYIYAVLHSPSYREKYNEFLKIDFPRVPYPKDLQGFRNLAGLGAELRQIHLLESPMVENYITQYPEDGNNMVVKPRFAEKDLSGFQNLTGLGRVYINDTQYFDNVPEVAWNFYIGGYQPAQKWLKDRKDRKLEFDDILHYQKIIVALSETDRLMKQIDTIENE